MWSRGRQTVHLLVGIQLGCFIPAYDLQLWFPLLALRKYFTNFTRYRGQPFLIAATRIYVCQAQQKAYFISRKTAVVYFFVLMCMILLKIFPRVLRRLIGQNDSGEMYLFFPGFGMMQIFAIFYSIGNQLLHMPDFRILNNRSYLCVAQRNQFWKWFGLLLQQLSFWVFQGLLFPLSCQFVRGLHHLWFLFLFLLWLKLLCVFHSTVGYFSLKNLS